MPEFIPIDGVHNFRDFGGHETKSGARIKSKTLFRSGQFSGLSEKGLNQIKSLGPKTLIDLRKANERAKQPGNFGNFDFSRIENNHLNIDTNSLPPHLEFLQEKDRNYDEVFDYMVKATRRIPFEPDHKIIFRDALKALANHEIPVIIHCTAGKDRTGILCAIILKILEVDEAIIIEDYLHTNHVPGHENIIIKYAEFSSEQTGRYIPPEIMRPMGQVHEDFISAAFDEINAEFETLENYLAHIGISQSEIKKIRSNLLL